MKTKKTSYPPINIGTSFMLVVFIIICMVIFSALSLSSALKDYDSSQKAAERTRNYYNACNQAEEIRAEIESQTATQDMIEYTVPIDENEILHVTLKRRSDNHPKYSVYSWTKQSTAEWSGNQTLPVLGSQ